MFVCLAGVGGAAAVGYTTAVVPATLTVPQSETGTLISRGSCHNLVFTESFYNWTGTEISSIYIDALDPSCFAPARIVLRNAAGTQEVVYEGTFVEGTGSFFPVDTAWDTTEPALGGFVSSVTLEVNPS